LPLIDIQYNYTNSKKRHTSTSWSYNKGFTDINNSLYNKAIFTLTGLTGCLSQALVITYHFHKKTIAQWWTQSVMWTWNEQRL